MARKPKRDLTVEEQLARGPLDLPFLMLTMLLLGVGLIMMFSASFATAYYNDGDPLVYIKNQAVYAAAGVVVMLLVSKINYQTFRLLSVPGIVAAILLLVLALSPLGVELNEVKRWVRIGPIQFQPSEVAKVAVILFFATRLSKRDTEKKKKWSRRTLTGRTLERLDRIGFLELVPYGAILMVIALLMLMEPHMSGILLTTAIVGTILLLGGSGGIITWGCAGAALFLLETLLKHVDSIDYLQSRLDGWTQDLDRMTSQTKQSLYAIGSGGATGLGLGNSIEKQLWLPESTNDFIFSVVCEELGFVGAVIVIVLFVLFLVQGFWIAFHAENRFCTLVGIGIMAQIAWQVFCNIAVVTNTLPNTGISLPFFSSGGTSLILLLAEMGVMVNIGRNGERARLEREEAHAERERQRKAKTIVLDTARRAQTEQ